MKYTLRPHQERTYQNITKHLPNKDRLQYISACGTGKTLVGFNLIQDLLQDKDKTIVLLLYFMEYFLSFPIRFQREVMVQNTFIWFCLTFPYFQ